jgi:hypothetical protein
MFTSDCFLSEIVTGFAASVAQQSCRAKFMKAGLRLLDQCSLFLTIVRWIVAEVSESDEFFSGFHVGE